MGCGDVDGDGVEDVAVGHAANNVVYVLYMAANGTVKSVGNVAGLAGLGFALWCGRGLRSAGAPLVANVTLLASAVNPCIFTSVVLPTSPPFSTTSAAASTQH